jgi:hypothetical protein
MLDVLSARLGNDDGGSFRARRRRAWRSCGLLLDDRFGSGDEDGRGRSGRGGDEGNSGSGVDRVFGHGLVGA